ncbi:cytoplasmic tRNA 2-thiolation protein 1 [Coccinella septempunctata]|uniref:cytoplasmic tRNA 2-thiolation protein 1 n=1 Tax=Coccinella septempunctata TaxID=41139 RepID=UPI001D09621B|nr:cytoplasmic tRNA 2-thiolation protein 1 [Coccinella septempunctata]
MECSRDCGNKAVLKRPKSGDKLCKQCFFEAFEDEIHFTITEAKLFKPGSTVAVAASGGKDSTVLAYVLKHLNRKYNYNLKFMLLSIDEGITGYRDDSLETVKQNRDDYEMPLKILSYKDLYGWTMDEIVSEIGRKNNCTFCGVFRRQALDRGAHLLRVDYLATGHNADDIAETVLMNILRGDLARLSRCTSIITDSGDGIPRVKPLKYAYEKEIVMYAYFKKLVYFSTECTFSPNAYRGHARVLLKDLEKVDPSVIMNIIHSGESLKVNETSKMPTLQNCTRCGYVSSQDICKACILLEGLNTGEPNLGIGKSSKVKKSLAKNEAKKTCCGGKGNCNDKT